MGRRGRATRDIWATEREARCDVVDRYRRVWDHSASSTTDRFA